MSDKNQNDVRNRIMIVDDSPQEIHVLLEELKDDFAVNAATSADDMYALLESEELPNLILLDVNMPGTNGYEACEHVKSQEKYHDIDIIFLSSNDTTEEITRGLDAGASDYITKPYDPDVLRSKIRQVTAAHAKRISLKEQADSANKMVYSLISESGNLGNIVNFLRASFTITSPENLMSSAVDTLNRYGLNAVLYFNAENIRFTESTNGVPTMLEIELLERMHGYPEPIVEKNTRAFIVKDNIVALIKNMPSDDEKRGALRDQLMILMEGADSKLQQIADLARVSTQKVGKIHEAVTEAKNSLDEIHALQESHKKINMEILDGLVEKMEKAFFSMALTDKQEAELMDIVSTAVHKSLDNFEHGLEVDEKIKKIVVELSQLARSSVD